MPEGRLPNFLCIGAPRSGTTWLYECLKAHPEAFVPELKEVCFFIRDEFRTTWHNGLGWYRSLFASTDPCVKVWGELSPRYYFLDRTPALIQEHIPDVKIIYLLRHPVEVLHSLAAYHLKMYPLVIDSDLYGFFDYIDHHLTEPLGFYAKYYKRFTACFAPEQIFVGFYEDLRRAPGETFAMICRFLDIDASFTPPMIDQRINSPTVPRRFGLSVLSNGLAQRLGRPGRIILKMDERFNRIAYKKSIGARKNLVTEEIFKRLMSVYDDDIHELESLTGRDLQHWFAFQSLESSIRVAV